MHSTKLSGCFLSLAFVAGVLAQEQPTALKQFEGKWRLLRFEEVGKEIPLTDAEKSRTMTIEGNRWDVSQNEKRLWSGRIKVVDSDKDPIQVDLVTTSRTDGIKPGDMSLAIWRVAGTLHTAGAYAGKARPTRFRTAEGAEWTYQQWVRVSRPAKVQGID